jgi:hypothetical protein
MPFIDYLWQLWSPTFKNDAHLRSIKETLSSPGYDGGAQRLWRPVQFGNGETAADERDAYTDADDLWQQRSDNEVFGEGGAALQGAT